MHQNKNKHVYKGMTSEELKECFQRNNAPCAENLPELVWQKICIRIEQKRKTHKFIHRSIGLFSLIALVPAGYMFYSSITSSGFMNYLSLAFSTTALNTSLKELAFVLAETLPVLSVVLCLFLFLTLLVSIKNLNKESNYQLKLA